MRAKEFINELNMSPSKLAGFAQSSIGQSVVAGFEAELVFNKLYGGSDPTEDGELDYDDDPRITKRTSFDDIKEYYDVSRYDLNQIEKQYNNHNSDYFETWVNENWDDLKRVILRDEPELNEILNDPDNDDYDEAMEKIDDLTRDYAAEEFSIRESMSFGEYLLDIGLDWMSDLGNEFSITWKKMKSVGDWSMSAEEVSEHIQQLTGHPVEISYSYHGETKKAGTWYIEPDGSIESDEYFGAEIVSPPLPLTELLATMETVLTSLSKRYGAVSIESTGFHVGISIPNIDVENIDYVKLALFLGDDYVLAQFKREANGYARSTIQSLYQKTQGMNQDSTEMVNVLLRSGLMKTASSIIAKRNSQRHMSINVNENYIEFRSAGNTYMNNIPQLKNLILRYAQAYAVAADPKAYYREYARKLGKLLYSGNNDDLDIFASHKARIDKINQVNAQIEKVRQANPGEVIPDYSLDDPVAAKNALKGYLKQRQGKAPGIQLARSPAPKLPDSKYKQQPLIQFPEPTQPNQNTQNNQNNS